MTSNIATYGELGRYSLYIDTVLTIIKCWLRISKDSETDTLVKGALQNNYVMFQNKNRLLVELCLYDMKGV